MTPEERRARIEYIAKMAKQGILAEPAYDRELWRAEFGKQKPPVRRTPKKDAGTSPGRKKAARRTA